MQVLSVYLYADLVYIFTNFLLICYLMQLELVKFVASNKPLIAGVKVSERVMAIVNSLLISTMPAQV